MIRFKINWVIYAANHAGIGGRCNVCSHSEMPRSGGDVYKTLPLHTTVYLRNGPFHVLPHTLNALLLYLLLTPPHPTDTTTLLMVSSTLYCPPTLLLPTEFLAAAAANTVLFSVITIIFAIAFVELVISVGYSFTNSISIIDQTSRGGGRGGERFFQI